MIFHKKKLVYHDEPAMMTNMPETSNSELTDTNILINVILIVRLLHTSKSNQGGSRCWKKCLFRKHAEKFANL